MKKEQLSIGQVALLIIFYALANAQIIVTDLMYAKRDAVWSSLLTPLFVLFMPFFMLYFKKRYPGKNIIEYSQEILGNIGSTVVGIFYGIFALVLCSFVTRNSSDFINIEINPDMPVYIISLLMILVSAYAAYRGLKAIGKFTLFMAPFIFLLIIVLSIMSISNGEIKFLFPMFENGLRPVLKGILSNTGISYFETYMFYFIVPYTIIETKRDKIQLYLAYIFSGILLAMRSLLIITHLGIEYPYKHPLFTTLETIVLDQFFERMELLFIIIWGYTVFIRAALNLWTTLMSFEHVFHLKKADFLLVPIGITVLLLSLNAWKIPGQEHTMAAERFPLFAAIPALIIPLTLFIVDQFKKRQLPESTQ